MNTYYVGISGGGSKCRILIRDQSGKELYRQEESGPSNIATNYKQAWDNIKHLYENAVEAIRNEHKIDISVSSQVYIGLGLPGVSVIQARKSFLRLLEESQLFASSKLGSDADAAYWSAFNGENGIIIISGTGSIAMRYQNGEMIARYGGMGFPHEDDGSLAQSGRDLTNLVLKTCGALLTEIGSADPSVNLKNKLIEIGTKKNGPKSADACLTLALLEEHTYYSDEESKASEQIKWIYKGISELELYQRINSGERSAAKYAKIGGALLDIVGGTKKGKAILEKYPSPIKRVAIFAIRPLERPCLGLAKT
jgi:hypothetical protein